MSNNKQHLTDWIFEQLEEKGDLRDCESLGIIQLNIDKIDYVALKKQAKKMYQNEIEQAKLDAKEIVTIKEYPTTSTTLYCQQFTADLIGNSSTTRCIKCGKPAWQHYQVTHTI